MCFTELPIEFDEEGNPYLKEEAEEIEHPDCGCAHGVDEALDDLDPEEAYGEVVETLPAEVREQLDDPGDAPDPEPQEMRGD